MLKAQLHIHTKEDPEDSCFIKYSARELIDTAAKEKFEVLAITCHNKVVFNDELKNYALSKNIVLIPAVERTIQGKHVLIYNISNEESQRINSFSDLGEWKKRKLKHHQPTLIIAAHPFFFGHTCLKEKIIKHLSIFDAWEYSFFYTKWFNPNKKMVKLSKQFSKPILGNADVHKLADLNLTYSLIDSPKDLVSIFGAIKAGRSKIISRPLKNWHFLKTILWVGLFFPRRFLKKYKNL